MKLGKWLTLCAVVLGLLVCGTALAENQYYAVSAPVDVASADTVTLTLNAQPGWMWNISDNTDVTAWFVKVDGTPAFADAEGVASGKLVYGSTEGEEEDVPMTLEIAIDASKISAFTENGTFDLYILPTGKSTLWVTGENHGQYVDSIEPAGRVVIPAVSVDGKLTADAGMELNVTNGTVQVVLDLEGIDDSLIDSSAAQIALLPGDGYKLYEVNFEEGTLSNEWNGGRADYTMGNISGNFSPQGGDGNGHYDFRIGVSGLKYNGLPLSEAVVRTDFYSFGRTFEVTGGSLILNTEPVWSSVDEVPVICDAYPDTVTARWPVAFDASALTAQDVTVTLISTYGDELTLEPETDYTVAASENATDVTVSYIYWAYAPVYNVTIYDYIYDQAGNHLTADDIVWCYETAIASGNLPKLSSSIESVTKLDEYTAQFKFTALAIGDLGALLMECPIVTRAAYEASPDQMATDPVSTTAYAITEHVSGSKIVFENTGNYWQTDASKIRKTSAANVQTIEFDIIPDGSQLTNALKTRAIDVTVWLSDTDIVDFQNAEGYSLASIPDNTTYGMIFNDSANGSSIFKDNLEARQAVAYAIDNNMLVQGALDGNGNPAYTIGNENYSDFLAKWKEEDYYDYDPTKATELAQSSGLAGQTITVMYVSTDINSKLFSIIQALLGQIGVNVEGLGIDTQLYNQYKYEDDKWDICLIQDGSTSYLVNVWKMEWDRTGYTHGGAVNFVVDDELQQLLETAMDADLHNDETMDAFHRCLTDNCYGVGLMQQMSNVAHTDTIKVLATDARGQVIPGGCEY